MTEHGRERLKELLRTRSFERRRVVLASGRESDFFIDCKQTVLLALGHLLVGQVMLDATRKLCPDASVVAGVDLGGCPLVSAVAYASATSDRPLDAVYVRKEAKDHGSKRLLEGGPKAPAGVKAALLEDVVTTGGSTLRAAEKLRDAGYVLSGVIALVDRQEGGREAIAAAGLPFSAIFTRQDFIADGAP